MEYDYVPPLDPKVQGFRIAESNRLCQEISDGIIQDRIDVLVPGQIVAQSLQEYLERIKNAQHRGVIKEVYDEPVGHRFGFKTTDGKIVSIHMQTLKDYPFRLTSKDGEIPGLGITVEEAGRKTVRVVLSQWFCDMEFDVVGYMMIPEGRRVILGLGEDTGDDGMYVYFDDGDIPYPEGYQGMQEVAHYNDADRHYYDEVEVECLDTLFPEKANQNE